MTTQLQKDVASNAGVIPIYPWFTHGTTKDNIPPRTYAQRLLLAKERNNQPGRIIQCNSDGCEGNLKSTFWRSEHPASRLLVPTGWSNYGGMGQFTICASCKANDVENEFVSEELDQYREEIDVGTGHTGSSSSHNQKPLHPLTVSLPRPRPTMNTERRPNMILKESELKEEARKLFKNHPDHLKAALQQIEKDERKKRANAAESRKRKRKGGKKKRTKKRGRKNRKKRTNKKKRRKRGGWERGQAGVDEPCVDNGACKKGLQCIRRLINVGDSPGRCKDLNLNEGGGKSRRKSRRRKRRKSRRRKRTGKTRKKRGGVRHALADRASNEMLEFFRNPATGDLIIGALHSCNSDKVFKCLNLNLNKENIPLNKDDFTPDDHVKYKRIIQICKPGSFVGSWPQQSGEGMGGGGKRRRKKRTKRRTRGKKRTKSRRKSRRKSRGKSRRKSRGKRKR